MTSLNLESERQLFIVLFQDEKEVNRFMVSLQDIRHSQILSAMASDPDATDLPINISDLSVISVTAFKQALQYMHHHCFDEKIKLPNEPLQYRKQEFSKNWKDLWDTAFISSIPDKELSSLIMTAYNLHIEPLTYLGISFIAGQLGHTDFLQGDIDLMKKISDKYELHLDVPDETTIKRRSEEFWENRKKPHNKP